MILDKLAFWIQPAKGFTKESRGVQVLKIDEIEERFQVELPKLYKELMRLQNGGYLRKYMVDEKYIVEEFSCIEELITFATYIEHTKELPEFKRSVLKSKNYCHPERVILFSQSGSSALFAFDYGWLERNKREKPRILIIRNDINEFENFGVVAEYSSFDEFIVELTDEQGMRYWCDTSILVESELSLEDFSRLLSKDLEVEMKAHEDDYYGWWNFERYFSFKASLVIDFGKECEYAKTHDLKVVENTNRKEKEADVRWVTCHLSPNQYLSGTFRFPEYASYNKIISFEATEFSKNTCIVDLAEKIQNSRLLKVAKTKIVNM